MLSILGVDSLPYLICFEVKVLSLPRIRKVIEAVRKVVVGVVRL